MSSSSPHQQQNSYLSRLNSPPDRYQAALGEEYSEKAQFGWRLAFSGVLIVSLLSTIFEISKVETVTEEECIRDYTFIFTAPINKYLQDHFDMTNRYIIYSSFLMDGMIITTFIFWFSYYKSYRVIITYLLFFGSRGVIQVSKLS